MKTKKPYYPVTAMSQRDNTGLDHMAGAGLRSNVCDQGQAVGASPQPGLKPQWLDRNYKLHLFFLDCLRSQKGSAVDITDVFS